MIIKPDLITFDPGEIIFHDLPLMTTDFIQLGFTELKNGDNLELTILVKYWMTETESGKILPVALATTKYNLETDGRLSVEDIYPICANSVNLLRNYINQFARIQGKPESNFYCSPLETISPDLQEIVDIFLSGLN